MIARVWQLARMALAGAVFVVPALAQAQRIEVGGNLGVTFDVEEDYLSVGADARFGLKNPRWVINPRFTLYLPEQGSSFQLDGNLLYMWEVPAASKVKPYSGVGAAIVKISYDIPGVEDDSEIGYNLVTGAQYNANGPVRPYVTGQYTVIQDFPNYFVLHVGATFTLRGGASALRPSPRSR